MKTIIEMAREAKPSYKIHEDDLQCFADLVRADEREACARLAENRMLADENKNKRIGYHHACKAIATDIRARGQA